MVDATMARATLRSRMAEARPAIERDELLQMISAANFADVVVLGSGMLEPGVGGGAPTLRYTFTAVRVSDAQQVGFAEASVPVEVSGGGFTREGDALTQSVNRLAEEATGRLACTMGRAWGGW
jgi:hypothetical protein